MSKQIDLGEATAYAIAKKHGYVGTEAQFAAEMTGAAQAAREAAQDASDAEAYAVGTRDGSDVPSTDPTYHNNAKYYAESLQVDATLTQQGKPADAKKVGDEITNLKGDLSNIKPLSDEAKAALLNCFLHVWWNDEHGRTYYEALQSALYENQYPMIRAIYNGETHVVYTDESVNSLKPYLTVTYFENKDSTGQNIPSTDYTISGTLREGESNLTVNYNGYSTIFTVNAIDFYNTMEWLWTASGGNMELIAAAPVASTSHNNDLALTEILTATNRKVVITRRGIRPFINSATGENTIYYPIPVPPKATGFTVTIEPSSQYTGPRTWKYDESTGLYTSVKIFGWKQGTYTGTIDNTGEGIVMSIGTKYDSAGTSYPTAPTKISVSFTE